MRAKLMVVALIAFFAFAGSAQAFEWHMRYGQAKHETLAYSEEACAEVRGCLTWGVGSPCYRASNSRFDCLMALFFEGVRPGEQIECNSILHWGVNRSGIIALKNQGEPNCFAV